MKYLVLFSLLFSFTTNTQTNTTQQWIIKADTHASWKYFHSIFAEHKIWTYDSETLFRPISNGQATESIYNTLLEVTNFNFPLLLVDYKNHLSTLLKREGASISTCEFVFSSSNTKRNGSFKIRTNSCNDSDMTTSTVLAGFNLHYSRGKAFGMVRVNYQHHTRPQALSVLITEFSAPK